MIEHELRLAELYEEGHGIVQIGEIVGYSREWVRLRLKRMGVKLRPAHAPRWSWRPCKQCGKMITPRRRSVYAAYCSSVCLEKRLNRKSKRPGW